MHLLKMYPLLKNEDFSASPVSLFTRRVNGKLHFATSQHPGCHGFAKIRMNFNFHTNLNLVPKKKKKHVVEQDGLRVVVVVSNFIYGCFQK